MCLTKFRARDLMVLKSLKSVFGDRKSVVNCEVQSITSRPRSQSHFLLSKGEEFGLGENQMPSQGHLTECDI